MKYFNIFEYSSIPSGHRKSKTRPEKGHRSVGKICESPGPLGGPPSLGFFWGVGLLVPSDYRPVSLSGPQAPPGCSGYQIVRLDGAPYLGSSCLALSFLGHYRRCKSHPLWASCPHCPCTFMSGKPSGFSLSGERQNCLHCVLLKARM